MSYSNGDVWKLDEDDLVAHVRGSSADSSKVWKKHWEKMTGRKFPSKCKIQGCGKLAKVGAHVYVKYNRQNWIIPACTTCNRDGIHDYDSKDDDCWVSINYDTVAVWVPTHDNTREYY